MGLFGYKCCKCKTKVDEFDTLDVHLYNYAKVLSGEYLITKKEAVKKLEENAVFEDMDAYFCADCAGSVLQVPELIRQCEEQFAAEKTGFNPDDEGFSVNDDEDSDDDGFSLDDDKSSNTDTSDLEEKLAKLKKLHDKGLISDSDFEKKKDEILSEL